MPTPIDAATTEILNAVLPPANPTARPQVIKIREEVTTSSASSRDVETLAQCFTDARIADDGTVKGRVSVLLNATEHALVPGLQTGIEFHDVGFKLVFRDPHPESDNQVGHFLTAVGLAFNPSKVNVNALGRPIRDWIEAPSTMTDEEVALRLVIGHELAPDPGPETALAGAAVGAPLGGIVLGGFPVGGGLVGAIGGGVVGAAKSIIDSYKAQFNATTVGDLAAFNAALLALGLGPVLDLVPADVALGSIATKINPSNRGNSVQDLRLSLVGWRLGKEVLLGSMTSTSDVSSWVRSNLSV